MRKIINLNDYWLVRNKLNGKNYLVNDGMELVNIPHTVVETPFNNFDETNYQRVSSYKKTITVSEKFKGKRVILNFEGVMTYSEVYINDLLVSVHKGGYTPFKIDITDNITVGEEFTIFVKVDSNERNDIPPFGFVIDYLTYGGIYREVYLEVVEDTHIDKMFIKTLNVLDTPTLDIDLFINNPTNKKEELLFNILEKGKSVYKFKREVDVKRKINITQEFADAKLWDLDNPNLYSLEVTIVDDTYVDRFGFREVRINESGFFLNDDHIKLIGLNRHQSYPYVGYAMPKNVQMKDADILKYELGLNTVRSSHYPPSKHFLDRCDEIGLLVFNEIPGWQHIGDEQWQEIAVKNVEEMIERDFNHPSIYIWGVRINESGDNDEFYTKTNKLARELDNTRPTGGVRFISKSNLLEDVYTMNDFNHRGHNEGLLLPKKIMGKKAPYMVTEYNGHMFPTKKFDDEAHRIEHAYRHLRVQNDNYKYDQSAGAIGWCMFDYNTHKDFGSGDKICYHGVMDMFRIPKYAASVYASQGKYGDVLEVCSSLNQGEYAAGEIPPVTIFTNCDYVKFYKNDLYINTFYKNTKEYAYIPNAPIIVDDFIGDLIEKNEKFSKKRRFESKKCFERSCEIWSGQTTY